MKKITSVLIVICMLASALFMFASCGNSESAEGGTENGTAQVWTSEYDLMASVDITKLIKTVDSNYYEAPEYSKLKITVTLNPDGTESTVIDSAGIDALTTQVIDAVLSSYAKSFEDDAAANNLELSEALGRFGCSTLEDYKNMLKAQMGETYKKTITDMVTAEYTGLYKLEDKTLYFYPTGTEFNVETAIKVSENYGDAETIMNLSKVSGEAFASVTFTK